MQADSGRNLLIAWIALSAITLVSLWIGLRGAGDALAPDALLSTAAIVIMLVKVRVIFRQFMEVGHAPVLLGRITDTWLLLTGCCLLAAVLSSTLIAPASAQAPPEDPDQRAARLLGQMTRDEKLSLLLGFLTPMYPKEKVREGIPSTPGFVPGIARLGIPPLVESDASLGVANMGGFMRLGDGATALPSALAMAASFNPDAVEAAGRAIGAETRAKGMNVLLAGGANLVREPRNGRNFEYFGEDPLLSGVMAGHAVRGIQSNRIISTVKHFALNAQETGRTVADVQMSESDMRESDLLAFQLAIEIGDPGSVMCAYNLVNGAHACENTHLLNDVLRRDWGYRGWVMSDWGAVHSMSLRQGLDQESGTRPDGPQWFGEPLRVALDKGEVTGQDVDRSVLRILRTMLAKGVVDDPVRSGGEVDYEANARLAQQVAEQGIVLLQNAGGVLPIPADVKRILVVGGHADKGVPQGGGSSQVWPTGGASLSLPIPGEPIYHVRLYMPSSPVAALKTSYPEAQVDYDDGTDVGRAAAAARDADVVVVFAEQFTMEGEDVPDLSLPDDQDALIAAVAAANPRTVVVLETGGPVLMPWLDRVPAVVAAWYPGQRGGDAIARVLSGAVNPSGRLPVTFPRSEAQLPNPVLPLSDRLGQVESEEAGKGLYDIGEDARSLAITYPEGSDVGYRWYAREDHTPLFAFGHGLSYTTFAAGGLKTDGRTASLEVRNTGERAGAYVAQLYLVSRDGSPLRRLVAFRRVELAPGEKQRIELEIDPRLLADWRDGRWVIPAGEYRFAPGENAAALGNPYPVRLQGRNWQ